MPGYALGPRSASGVHEHLSRMSSRHDVHWTNQQPHMHREYLDFLDARLA